MARQGSRARGWIVGILAVCLAAFAFLSFGRRLETIEPVVGVEWVQAAAGPTALLVAPGSPASAAGIEAGDLLLRVNGRPVPSTLDAAQIGWDGSIGAPLRLELRRATKQVVLELEPGSRPGAPAPYVYLSVVALAFLVSSVFIAVRWPTVRGGTIYAFLGACLFTLLVVSHSGRADALDWSFYWVDVVAGSLAPALLLHLSFALSRRAFPAWKLGLGAAYLGAAGLLVPAVWLVGIGGVHRFSNPVVVAQASDRLQLLFLGVAVLVAACVLIRSYHRSASGLHRSQMRFMLWGLGVGLVPFVGVYAMPWALGAAVPSWAQFFAVIPMLVVPAAFTAALARYRLHDLDLLLRKGLAEVTAFFFVLAVYAAAKEILRAGLAGLVPLSPSGLRYLAIVLSVVAYPKVREWVHAGVDRAFYRKRYSYRATLLDWGRELNAEIDLPSLLRRVEERVCETLGLPEAHVLVRTQPARFEAAGEGVRTSLAPGDSLLSELERERCVVVETGTLEAIPRARYLFGMKVKGNLRAILVTAERENPDEPLTSEDRALLSTLCAHAGAAIESARLVREVRQQAEQVERLQLRQERILESSGVGLLLMDGERRILAWNRALEEIYGLPRDRSLGRRIEEVFPLHLIRRIERELGGRPEGQEVRIYRYTLVNSTGARIVVNLSVSQASPEQGGSGARVMSFDDVTERVKLEEQVLRQERLASLGLLAAGVAHEVNTPLTGISGYTQMLLEELSAEDPRREILEKIEAQSHRASAIANSLLNLARPERAPLEDLCLNDTIQEVLPLFEPQLRGRGIRLETRLGAGLLPVRGNRGKLQQVLLNLLLNARDAVADGGQITVITSRRGNRVVLEVLDDGVGIADEDLPRIFDPFFTTKGRGRGTGLGLSITYGIIQEHKGEMQVESTPGEFTRFRIELPSAGRAEASA